MLIIRNILAFLLLLALLALSIVGVMTYFPHFGGWTNRINVTGDSIIAAWQPKNGLFWTWLGLLLATLLTLGVAVLARRKPTRIEVQMGDGRIVILESAIRKYIKTALADLPEVTSRKIELRHVRAGLQADIYANVRTHEKLPDLERAIIRRVRQALSDELGITAIAAVHVYIRDFEVKQKHHEETIVAAPPPRMTPATSEGRSDSTPATETEVQSTLPNPVPAPAFQPSPRFEDRIARPITLEETKSSSGTPVSSVSTPDEVPNEITPLIQPVFTEDEDDTSAVSPSGAAPSPRRSKFFSRFRKREDSEETPDAAGGPSVESPEIDTEVQSSPSAITNEEISESSSDLPEIEKQDTSEGLHQ